MSLISSQRILSITSLALFLLFFGCNTNADTAQSAPDFTLNDLSGNQVSLSEHKGKPVLLDFWATWCPPCRKSIPELVDLQRRYGDQGLVILGISMDDPRQVNNKDLLAFKDYFKINYTILRASQDVVQDYFANGSISIPTMFVIDREGRIVDVHVGFRPGAVEDSIKKIIK